MIIAKVQCKCLRWVRLRTMPEFDRPSYEYGWRICAHNNGCGRKIEIERRGGQGARIVGKCDGEKRNVQVEMEE